jgi:tetratricopeptide (TPR) repeat protein
VDPAIDSAIEAKRWDEAERLIAQAIERSDSRDAYLCRAHVLLAHAARDVVSLDLASMGLPPDFTGTTEAPSDESLQRFVASGVELDADLAAAALAELDGVIARWPTDPEAHRCTLEVAQARRDHSVFLQALRSAGESLKPLGPEAAVDELLPYPARYVEKKDYAKASEAYRTLIEVYPLSAKLHSSYGVVLIAQGELDAAVARFAVAFDLDPHDPLVLGNAADAALYKRDFASARRFYELALRDSPSASGRYFDLAAIAAARSRGRDSRLEALSLAACGGARRWTLGAARDRYPREARERAHVARAR